jgi:hypothetical protein
MTIGSQATKTQIGMSLLGKLIDTVIAVAASSAGQQAERWRVPRTNKNGRRKSRVSRRPVARHKRCPVHLRFATDAYSAPRRHVAPRYLLCLTFSDRSVGLGPPPPRRRLARTSPGWAFCLREICTTVLEPEKGLAFPADAASLSRLRSRNERNWPRLPMRAGSASDFLLRYHTDVDLSGLAGTYCLPEQESVRRHTAAVTPIRQPDAQLGLQTDTT